MKYIILFILLLWIIRRVMNVFVLVSDDQKPGESQSQSANSRQFYSSSSKEEGFTDYEEVE